MKKKSILKIFIIFFSVFIILLAVKQGWFKKLVSLSKTSVRQAPSGKNTSPSPKMSKNIETNILSILKELEVKSEEIKTSHFLETNRKEIKTAIPAGKPVEWIIWHLSRAVENTPYHVSDGIYRRKKGTYSITYAPNSTKDAGIVLKFTKSKRYLRNSARIAFLVEDFEFQANKTTVDLLSFPEPLTISLLPFTEKNTWTAQAAQEYKKEIVIHLPFEPKKKNKTIPSSSIIMIHYPEKEIRKIIHDATKTIPRFHGFANLYGSIAVEDSRVMKIVLNEIKKYDAYFINTYVGRNSVVPRVAKKIAIDYKEISTVIPDNVTTGDIERKMKHFIDIARNRGSIIVTAKASKSLLKALKDILPYTKQYGVTFVYVSDIVHNPVNK